MSKELRETWIYRHEHLIYTVFGLSGVAICLILDKSPFFAGLMVGFSFTTFIMWAIRYQDLVQWRRNKNGLHWHDGQMWRLTPFSDD